MGGGSSRNKLCECGSGKKTKLCCQGRKPSSFGVMIEFAKPAAITRLRIGPEGQLEFCEDGVPKIPNKSWAIGSRPRTKGEKTLLRIPSQPSSLRLGDVSALLEYDRLFAIDTNTKIICGRPVSVACVSECILKRNQDCVHALQKIHCVYEFHGVESRQENMSWYMLILAIICSNQYDDCHVYGIITDSCLGEHDSYNSNTKPFFLGYYLPNNFSFIYSSDQGRTICNLAIRTCDNTSNKFLKLIQSGKYNLNEATKVHIGPSTHFREWWNSDTQINGPEWFSLASIKCTEIVFT